MTTGTMVYHIYLRMNLIVCQIDAKGKAICINPKIFDNNIFQTFTVNINDLVKGWKTSYD